LNISFLIVHMNRTAVSRDFKGAINHYYVSLISKSGEEFEVINFPIDVEKHGKIHQIVIFDGKNKTPLDGELSAIKRLIECCSRKLDDIRMEICPSRDLANEFPFDCESFSYYLKAGVDFRYKSSYEVMKFSEYRSRVEAPEDPYDFYFIQAWTSDFSTRTWEGERRVHHYMSLINGAFVSKLGTGKICFTSRQQILDLYFPEQFTEGSFRKPSW
jgi:hypothetical protein